MGSNDEKNCFLVFIFISLVATARIAHGFFTSVTGPTLPSLAENCGVSTGDVASVFTWKGLGQIIGAIVAGLAFPRITTGTWKLVWCGIFILFNGCAMAVMPFISDLWLLGVISFITSGTASFFNTGLESLVLVIWGPENSRGVIAIYHFFFTFGGFLAPLLVGLFKSTEDPLKSCSNKNVTDETPRSSLFSSSEAAVTEFIFEGDYFDQLDTDIIAPYLIVGGFVVFSGVLTIFGGFCKLAEKLTDEQEEIVDRRKEGKVKNLLLFFALDMVIHACATCMDTIFQSYIYTYAMCSDTFDYEPADANTVNTLFWIAFMIGRLSGTFIAVKLPPWLFIIIDCIGSIIGISLILGVDGVEANKAVLYAGTLIFGYFVACVYGCATNLCNGYTNMGLTYVFINNLGSSFGNIFGPRTTGLYVDSDPIAFAWSVLVVSIIALVTNSLIHLEGSRLHGISYKETFSRMIKGDCFTPKYEDFELEEEINNEDERESGTYEKNKVDESTTGL